MVSVVRPKMIILINVLIVLPFDKKDVSTFALSLYKLTPLYLPLASVSAPPPQIIPDARCPAAAGTLVPLERGASHYCHHDPSSARRPGRPHRAAAGGKRCCFFPSHGLQQAVRAAGFSEPGDGTGSERAAGRERAENSNSIRLN